MRYVEHNTHIIQTKWGVGCFQFSTWTHYDAAIGTLVFDRCMSYIQHVAMNAVPVASTPHTAQSRQAQAVTRYI